MLFISALPVMLLAMLVIRASAALADSPHFISEGTASVACGRASAGVR